MNFYIFYWMKNRNIFQHILLNVLRSHVIQVIKNLLLNLPFQKKKKKLQLFLVQIFSSFSFFRSLKKF